MILARDTKSLLRLIREDSDGWGVDDTGAGNATWTHLESGSRVRIGTFVHVDGIDIGMALAPWLIRRAFDKIRADRLDADLRKARDRRVLRIIRGDDDEMPSTPRKGSV